MAVIQLLLCYLVFSTGYRFISSGTDPFDAGMLFSLKEEWKNTPPSWSESFDPCGTWEGVTCINSRVTGLDLSFNLALSGTLTSKIGDLKYLETLILRECSFSGILPAELGNLEELSFLSLEGNNFTGMIPPSLGNLSKLRYLNLADNQLTGVIPVSTPLFPGLDLLYNLKQLNLDRNQLYGPIPQKLFSSNTVLTRVLFEGNHLTGEIPYTLGLVQTLESVHLGGNSLTGNVPSNINNLTNLISLEVQDNKLSGPLPNLSGMHSLLRLDLSNNSFAETEAPEWISTLASLNILIINNGPLYGSVPRNLFRSPSLVVVSLKNNAFNGTLQIDINISHKIASVDLENNDIFSISINPQFSGTLNLIGNPICSSIFTSSITYCQAPQESIDP